MNTDAQVLIRNTDEKMSEFNRRIADVCKESDVTGVSLAVFHGAPIITLTSEVGFPEDAAPDTNLTEADLEPISEPLTAKVCRIILTENKTEGGSTLSASESCARTEDVLNNIIAKGNGTVRDIQYSQCHDTKTVFALVSFFREEEVHDAEVVPANEPEVVTVKKNDTKKGGK